MQPFITAGRNLHSQLTIHNSPWALAAPAPAYAGPKRAQSRYKSMQPFLTAGSNLHSQLTPHASRLTTHVLALPAPAYAGSKRAQSRYKSMQPFLTAGRNPHSRLTSHASRLGFACARVCRTKEITVQAIIRAAVFNGRQESSLTPHVSRLTPHASRSHNSHQLALYLRS